MQTTEFDYNSVPRTFAHCLNEQCPQSSGCLRRMAALHVPANCQYIKIVNPAYTPAAGEQCPFYKSGELLRFACGIKHLYDNLPHQAALSIKQVLLGAFGRSEYYRRYRKEILLSPQEQAYIRSVFHRYGVETEPVYDGFVNGYAW